MKLKHIFYTFAAIMLSAFTASAATTIADWTFETSAPAGVPGAGVWLTNISAEIGTGTASALHATSSTYTSATGNGSAKSFIANAWTGSDFFQFVVSTTGLTGIVVSLDSVSSATGPAHFNLAYSLDGVSFTNFAAYTNANSTFSTGSSNATFTKVFNLSAVTAINNAATVYFRMIQADAVAANGGAVNVTAGTSRIDNMIVTGSSGAVLPPVVSGVTPASTNLNAGANVTFTVSLSQGDSPLSYYWYKTAVSSGNLLATQTNASLVLSNITAADAGSYYVVVSNASLTTSTGGPVTLTIADPGIDSQPLPTQSLLLGSTANFTVHATGTAPLSYQWCTGDPVLADAAFTPVPANSHISGGTTPTLTVSNLTAGDATSGNVNNYFCVVTSGAGTNTTTPVNISVVSSGGTLAFWDFNGFLVTLAAPMSSAGAGFASITNITDAVFTQGTGSDNNDTTPENVSPITVPILNNALSTATYPAVSASNQTAGVRYNLSTAGAKNIIVNYDVRETATASKYTRLQYTTNGTDFTNYPATATYATGAGYPQVSIGKFVGPITVDLTGFPGVANNPNFGIRIVSEFISSATYGFNPTNSYVAVSNGSTYSTAGTITYDQVSITGNAITGPFTPPTISPIPNQSVPDSGGSVNVTLSFSGVGSPTATASVADSTVVSANVSGNTLTVTSTGPSGASPVLVKVTDGNGDSTVTSFIATVVPANSPPVITGLGTTNCLANAALSIPFTITDDHTPANGQSFSTSVTYSNSSLVSSINVLNGTTGSPTLQFSLITNVTGVVPITVTVADNDPSFPKSSAVTFTLEVRPSTNVYLNDNFGYNNGPLITNSAGFWVNHSGTPVGVLQVSNGTIVVDGLDKTEDVNATLIGAPFPTNTSGVLFARYDVNFSHLPDFENTNTGAYISHFKDTGTVNFFCKVFASTNNAASTNQFLLGIGDGPNLLPTDATYLAQNFVTNVTYTIVTRMVLSNALSTIWVNPMSTNDPSATDTNVAAVTNIANVTAYAFRENFGGGIANVSNLRIGNSFQSVVDTLVISPVDANGNVVVTWGNPTFTLQGTTNLLTAYTNITGATSPYTNSASDPTKFFRLHELQGFTPGN